MQFGPWSATAYVSTYVLKGLGGYRIREVTTQRLDGFVKALNANHGPSVAKSARVILSGMFGLAVRYGAVGANPVRDVGTIKMESKAAGPFPQTSCAGSWRPCVRLSSCSTRPTR